VNGYDLVVIIFTALLAWRGWRTGLVGGLLAWSGFVLGLFLALRFDGVVGDWLSHIHDVSPTTRRILALLAILLAVEIATGLLAGLLSRFLARIPLLGSLNRAGGVLLGALFALASIWVATAAFLLLPGTVLPFANSVRHSETAHLMRSLTPRWEQNLRVYIDRYDSDLTSGLHTLGSLAAGLPGHSAAPGASRPLTRGRVAEIAAGVDPGLVDVNVTLGYAGAEAAGTGMVLTSSGEVLTNNHVIYGGTSISVTDLGNGRRYAASVVGYDRSHDVAVLQLRGASHLATVSIGDSANLAVGTAVVAIGNAGGRGGTPRAAAGLVTALNQSITAGDVGGGNSERLSGLIEVNDDVQPGDSGGPLVTSSGQVVGVDTAVSVSKTLRAPVSQAFVIPINRAVAIGKQIMAAQGSATVHIGPTGFLGVEIQPSGDTTAGLGSAGLASGAVIGGVLPGAPAQQAGLSAGDVITSLDGQAVRSGSALPDRLVPYHPGDVVRLGWVDRSGRSHTSDVQLASGPPS
jgi:S1-C subfamily serine protease/uncharacterized membrane protein required for colicin V production